MKSLFIKIITITLLMSSCFTTKTPIALMRDQLDKNEPWRYEVANVKYEPKSPQFPIIKKAVLKNGLSIMVMENKKLPIAHLAVVIKGGASQDPSHLAGLTYLSALMLKEGGSKDLTSLDIAEKLANLGSELTVSVTKNAVSFDVEMLSDKLHDSFNILSAIITTPRLHQEDFVRVKHQHEGLLASKQASPSYLAQVNFMNTIYGENHPYAHPSHGSLKSVGKINHQDIKKYVEEFNPNQALLIAIGDVSFKEIKHLAKKYLGSWKRKDSQPKKIPDPKTIKTMQTKLISRPDSLQSYLLLGRLGVDQKHEDWPALEVLGNIIAGLPTSRLGMNLREHKGWTYGVQGQMISHLNSGYMMITTSLQAPFGADAIKEIFKELDNMKNTIVSDDELDTAKRRLLDGFLTKYSTLNNIANYMADHFIYDLPLDYEEKHYHNIANLSKEDIQKVARKYLDKNHMSLTLVGDLEALNPVFKLDVGNISVDK